MLVFIFLDNFGLLSGRLSANSCSLGLRYVFFDKVPNCLIVNLVFFHLGFWNGDFFFKSFKHCVMQFYGLRPVGSQSQ